MDYDEDLMPHIIPDLSKITLVGIFLSYLIVILWLIFVCVFEIIDGADFSDIDLAIVCIVVLSVYVWALSSKLFARFNFCDEGLWVKFPLCQWQMIPWNAFQQICICYTEISKKYQYYGWGVICFVKKGEKKDMFGQWKSDNVFHHRSVITVSLTEESLLKLQLACNAPIVDLRGTRIYPNPINAKLHIKLKTPEELQKIREAMKKADTEN